MFNFARDIPEAVRSESYIGNPNHYTHIIPHTIDLIVGKPSSHGHHCVRKTFSHHKKVPAVAHLSDYMSNEILPGNRAASANERNWIYLSFMFYLPNNHYLASHRICPLHHYISTDVIFAPWELCDGELVNRYDIPQYIFGYYADNFMEEINSAGKFPLNGYLKLCLNYEKTVYRNWPIENVSTINLPEFETSLDLLTKDYARARAFFADSQIG